MRDWNWLDGAGRPVMEGITRVGGEAVIADRLEPWVKLSKIRGADG
jgi:hypothetical protein